MTGGGDRGARAWRWGLLAATTAAFGFLYLPLTRLWLLADDPHWMWMASTTRWREILFDPERFRAMAPNFTPMLGVVFKADWDLFGLDPAGYVWHSLAVVLLACAALYLLLRSYAGVSAALLGVLLFLLSPTTLVVASWLSTRHYVEGMFWALLALWLARRSATRERPAWLAAAAFLVAALFKEVYAVLPAVAALLVPGPAARRARVTAPLWLGLAIYAGWHLWIMGGLGGYLTNEPLSLATVPRLLQQTARALALHFARGDGWTVVLVGAALAAAALRERNLAAPGVLATLLVPLIPIAHMVAAPDVYSGRYMFHLAVAGVAWLAVAAERAWRRFPHWRWATAAVVALLALAFVGRDVEILPRIAAERAQVRRSAEEFLGGRRRFIVSVQPAFFYESLRKLYARASGAAVGTQLVPLPKYLKYASAARLAEMKASGVAVPADEIAAFQARLLDAPIEVHLRIDGLRLAWEFGPDPRATYTVVVGPESGLYTGDATPLRARGSVLMTTAGRGGTPTRLYARVLYDRADGREVISPEVTLEFPGEHRIDAISPSSAPRP
ncbi:MAG TPA: glycosyltransferase family 39 protein [Thermoanaerobaculaceae bacterium]|nr:glycosyltransferase family 39 protein [Thermoanaerobaculaceae bacterium]